MIVLRRFGASAAITFLWLIVLAAPALTWADRPERISRSAFSKVDREDLAAPIREKGEVRVIVGMRTAQNAVARGNAAADRTAEIDVAGGQARLLQRLQRHDLRHVKRFRAHPFVAMTVDAAALADLLADPEVTSIAEDRPVYPVLYDTPGITRADKAWLAGYRGAGQTVAIIDTGVDKTHPFFTGKVVAEACFSNPVDGNTSYCPSGVAQSIGPGTGVPCADSGLGCWHGTHVAGIAAGRYGVLTSTTGGIAPDANVIAIQVFQRACPNGTCSLTAYDSDMGLALEYVYSLRNTYNIAAANMSLGGGNYTAQCDGESPALTTIINNLRDAGIATVVASGNASRADAISFPACISAAISVGSTTKQNAVSSFSNSASFLSVLAPGSGITSSMPGSGYGTWSGTSMATPHVAGAWALLKSAKPTATVPEVLTALQSSGLPITDSRNGITKPLIQLGYDAAQAGAIGALLGPANLPPAVALTSPPNGASFVAPANIALAAVAATGAITKVEFFQGATKIGQALAPGPYTMTWTAVPAGTYTLTAKAIDNGLATVTSAPAIVSVSANGPAAAPIAIASYRFNDAWGASGVATDTVGDHNGVRTGTVNPIAAPAAPPKPDTCQGASFSGGAFDVTGLPVATAAGAKTSVAFWMYWNGTDAVMPVGWQLQDLFFYSGSFGFNSFNADIYGISSTGLANGWHHVVAEFTNGNIAANKLYIDGILQTLTQRRSTPINANAVVGANLRIGGVYGDPNYRFAGHLDEVKVFSGALTPGEVTAEYTAASPCGSVPPPPPSLTLQNVASGFASPVDITSARDGSGKLFIVQQGGQIQVVSGGQVSTFLDIQSLVVSGGERGLLGLAFHPSYASNGYFFVHYTQLSDGATVIARYQRFANDPNLPAPMSGVILLTIPQPFSNHKGGQLRFGPDGYLYIGTGDGGSGNDPGNRAQNLNTLLGKMLRIDVSNPDPPYYYIPATNPFQNDGNTSTLGEIWAYGLRNPWRFSFDRLTGDLFIADVGQSAWEEVNFQPAGSTGGQNYGWRVMEGAHCTNLDPSACSNPGFTPPILEYGHNLGCSITGGHRYRGAAYPALAGYFIFGDYCSGRIWGATNAGSVWTSSQLLSTGFSISTFGEDDFGELYVAAYSTGVIYRITAQ